MHALVAFSNVLAGEFTTADLSPRVLYALGCSPEEYKLNSLRYDLSKLRAKGLVEKFHEPADTSSPEKDIASAFCT